ncbi:hypothetical protein, partial [Helicobacter sp. T3_23-1059]
MCCCHWQGREQKSPTCAKGWNKKAKSSAIKKGGRGKYFIIARFLRLCQKLQKSSTRQSTLTPSLRALQRNAWQSIKTK